MDVVIIVLAKYLYVTSFVAYLIFCFVLWRTNKQQLHYFLWLSLFSFPVAFVVGKILSLIISDPRPFVVEHSTPLIAQAPDNGFPSVYTLFTTAIASVVFTYNRKLGILLFVIAFLVGIARVQASLIHPFDILGATFIEISVTMFGFFLINVYRMYNDEPTTPSETDSN